MEALDALDAYLEKNAPKTCHHRRGYALLTLCRQTTLSVQFIFISGGHPFRTLYQTMQTSVKRLQRLQQVSDVLRRTSRFTILAKQVQTLMAELDDGVGAQSKAPMNNYDPRRTAKCDARASSGVMRALWL